MTNDQPHFDECAPGHSEDLEMATLQHMKGLTFEQKLAWLDAAYEAVVARYGRETARKNDGSFVVPVYRIPTRDDERSFFFPSDQTAPTK